MTNLNENILLTAQIVPMWGEKLITYEVDEPGIHCMESIYWIPSRECYCIHNYNVLWEMLVPPGEDEDDCSFEWDERADVCFWYGQENFIYIKRDGHIYAHALLREGDNVLIPALLRLCAEYLG